MKKLFILIFLGLMLVILYLKGMESESTENLQEEIEENTITLVERKEIFTSHNENIKKIKKSLDKNSTLSVELEEDMNVTRDFEITLTAEIDNLQEEEGYNCLWYEGKKFLGFGEFQTLIFPKGKHIITVNLKSTDGQEVNDTIVVTAWEYRKEATLFFNEETGELTEKRVRTYNYQDKLIQIQNSSELHTFKYNKEGQEIEHKYENFSYPELGFTKISEYDENGNNVKTEYLDKDGDTKYFNLIKYDENRHQTKIERLGMDGTLTQNIMEYDENGNQIKEEYLNNNGETTYLNIMEYDDENRTILDRVGDNESNLEDVLNYNEDDENSEEEMVEEDKVDIYNEDGYLVLKDEYSYGNVVESIEKIFNENNQTIEERQTTKYKDSNLTYSSIYKYIYDKEGNIINRETKNIYNGEEYCHYLNSSTYNKDGLVLISKNKILNGVCYEVDNLYVENVYDEEGNLVSEKTKSYSTENEDSLGEIHSIMKNENYYSNELND